MEHGSIEIVIKGVLPRGQDLPEARLRVVHPRNGRARVEVLVADRPIAQLPHTALEWVSTPDTYAALKLTTFRAELDVEAWGGSRTPDVTARVDRAAPDAVLQGEPLSSFTSHPTDDPETWHPGDRA